MELDAEGFIKVKPTLQVCLINSEKDLKIVLEQSVSHRYIFAAGDIASLSSPRPKVNSENASTNHVIYLSNLSYETLIMSSFIYSLCLAQAGVFAVRAGPPLAANIRKVLLGKVFFITYIISIFPL